ncbi:MAG: ABC transporter permease subunit [Verrucomicrobia bacterium]|nr:ABC transporter permease subunit [Verrucomicrobiota bacterium]
MANIVTLLKRQLRAYFHTPMAYVIMVAFLVVAGLSFCRPLGQHLGEQIGIGELLFGAPYFWVAVLAVIALITMPLFAEERRTGTLEMLLTAPVTDLQVVLGKYAGALVFFLLMTTPTAAYFILLKAVAPGMAALDWTPIFTGYLSLWLIGSCFIAIGMFVSALTRSQVVAAVGCFVAVSILFFMDTVRLVLPGAAVQAALTYLSSTQHVQDFAQGVVDTRPIVFYLSLTVFFVFATVKAIEARQWK